MILTTPQKDNIYDIVVVGASFAGLSFASGAAVRGLRVLVLEKDVEIGGLVRTTGILFSDVLVHCKMESVKATRTQGARGS